MRENAERLLANTNEAERFLVSRENAERLPSNTKEAEKTSSL